MEVALLVVVQIVQLWLGLCTALPNSHRSNGAVNEPIFTNTIQRVVQNNTLSNATEQIKPLKKVFLSNRSITCNDGSQSGFYLRKSHTSKKWIIFLEGGWYCYDQQSCKNRWQKQRHYMTSSRWAETRDVGGILSPSMEENPFWWNANHVFVPYCTSDAWSGTKKSEKQGMFNFMGSSIVLQVIRDLIPLGLENSTDLLLSGSSAGGIGVMLNLDFVQELLHDQMDLKQIKIRGVTDSGWFLDRTPYIPTVKPAVDAIRKGMEFWQGRVATRCREKYIEEPWRCYFGYRLYPTLKTELFVFQWLFDEAQMNADNVGAPVTKQQWDYVHQMGDALRQSFQNVSAVFAPSCISHSMLTKKDWQKVTIDDVSIAEALHCWEQKTNRKRLKKQRRGKKDQNNSVRVRNLDGSVTDRENKRRRKHGKNNKRARRRKDRQNANNPEMNRTRSHTTNSLDHRPVNRKQRRSFDRRCTHKKLERCSWPQCNHSCPKLHNPFTGEEMDFIELLKSFGLDMESVASALGIDMDTLNNMDQSELLNLLTQQSN